MSHESSVFPNDKPPLELTVHFLWIFFSYVMDELGSALWHKDEPNFRVAPFISLVAKIVYDYVLWLMIYYTRISGSFGAN